MTDQFMFHSKSANKPPGKGVDEHVRDPIKYEELAKITDWRKKLSNFWPTPNLIIDGKKWYSVEHYFHAMKFQSKSPEFANTFALESGSPWSVDPTMAKAVGGKTGKWKGNQIRPTNVVMRPDFYNGFDRKVMTIAMYNKFIQNPELKKVLLATKDARLTHKTRGTSLKRITELETVRKCIKHLNVPIQLNLT